MSSPKLSIIVGSICGALLIQCTGSHSVLPDGTTGDGIVGTADAADPSSCTPTPETFTKLAEADLGPQSNSPAIAVAGYTSLVVYVTSSTTCDYDVTASFRADASSPFGATGQKVETPSTNFSLVPGGRLRVDGTDLQLRNLYAGCMIHYVVAGVK